jgi:hypothetical protein
MFSIMKVEEFFDLRIATVGPGEEPPAEAHLARIEAPTRREVECRLAEGWFHKPCYVTYVIEIPRSLEVYIDGSFRSGSRNKPRKLLREVPRRYRLEVDGEGRGLQEFKALYRRTIVGRPRGRDRVGEHAEGFGPGWLGFHLYDGGAMVAGVLVHALRHHLSVAYGAFDPAHRKLDLEHFLIMQVMRRCMDLGVESLSLGMDTNRYGHHLPLGLAAYKLRIGFTPLPWEPAGRELVKIQSFDRFEDGLFFYAFEGRGMVGHLFTRGEPDLRPYAHHNAPEVRSHRIESGSRANQ